MTQGHRGDLSLLLCTTVQASQCINDKVFAVLSVGPCSHSGPSTGAASVTCSYCYHYGIFLLQDLPSVYTMARHYKRPLPRSGYCY